MSLHSFTRRLATLGSIAVSGFVVATTAAQANPPIIVNCNSGGQICDQMARYNFNSESPNFDYALQVTAPATHCSEVKYFTTNREGQRVETEFLGPNRSGFLPIGGNWQQGSHTIQIGAIGRQGGCNVGTLGSWGVQVRPVVVPR
ncbi:hypothetical protein NBE99_01640 [Thermosynechococcus sp. HN-54]|uniref:hypothetical protein n=1 Tax=Thermosynechococcus sp. HN-54 TaxID=2933959 RepID=UPI00202CE9D7|nr:hypothetical protein [Thermosynechococcus sp. HN-54]URR35860.1 hypothetical protein NBE99_01640 [Thermosynechococcus sp. HN-54]